MKKFIKIIACAICAVLLSSSLIGCNNAANQNRPDYSQNTEQFNIWAYAATQNDWYQINGVRYYYEQGMIQTKETTQMYKDANFNMLFINYTFSYNVMDGNFDSTDMKKVMDWAQELGLPCFVFHNTIHGMGSRTEPIIDKDKAIAEINDEFKKENVAREYYFDAYDYCKTNHNDCTSCTDDNLPSDVKDYVNADKAIEDVYANVKDRSNFYNETDLDKFVEINLKGLKDHPAFRGVTLQDEPKWNQIPQVGTMYRSIVRVCNADDNPLNDDPHVMMNMLPYNPADAHKPYFADGGKNMSSEEAYGKYLEQYYEHIGQYCGYFQYDDYPILNDSIWPTFLQAHQMTSEFCKEKGLERRMVMQTCKYSNRRAPNEADMYFQANVAEAFGNKEFSYYEYYPTANTGGTTRPDESAYIVGHEGAPNQRYYWVKDVNAEMQFNAKALKNFEYQGMQYKTIAPMPGGMGYVSGIHNDEFSKLKGFDFTAKLQSGGMLLVTELYDETNDQYGYFVVNTTDPAYSSELVVDLDFGDYKNVQIYQNSTIVDAKTKNGKATIYLGSGRGAFVMPY